MNVAICIVCRETLDSSQSSNRNVAGDESGVRDQKQKLSEFEGRICTLPCGHVLHVQCVYLWWKTITEQVRSQENVFGIGIGIGNHLAATGASGNPAPGRYSCPLCGTLHKKPVACELFLTFFDTGSWGGSGNDSGEKEKIKRQIEELTVKNDELSNHYAEMCRQERRLLAPA